MGSGAKAPSSLASFAYDWVGGDIHGLSGYAGTLYQYVPEITDVTKALNAKVSATVNASGWQGSAASSFTKAWEKDSTAATALAVAISGCGDVVNTLAVNLANIESALEQAADQAKAHGVPIGANGEPVQACLADPTAESWRAAYQGFWSQSMRSAAEARTEAAGALQSLSGQLAPDPTKDDGLGKGDYTALFDVLAGFWGAQTRYRGLVESKIPGLKNAVTKARSTAIEDARQANGQFGPWTDEDRQMFGDAGTKLAGVQGGLLLYGPVEITPELTAKAGLPAGMTAAYYASIAVQGKAERRPDDDKWQDAERLVRGLAARLGGTVHDGRPPMELTLDASVYSEQQLPAEEVAAVLRPYVHGKQREPGPMDAQGAYALRPLEGSILFLTMYFPPWMAGMKLSPPPPAVGELRRHKPSQWQLHTSVPVLDATPEVCQTVGGAALALAERTAGVVVDTYGFPVTRAEDLLPR